MLHLWPFEGLGASDVRPWTDLFTCGTCAGAGTEVLLELGLQAALCGCCGGGRASFLAEPGASASALLIGARSLGTLRLPAFRSVVRSIGMLPRCAERFRLDDIPAHKPEGRDLEALGVAISECRPIQEPKSEAVGGSHRFIFI